jgi:cell division protein FtsW
MVFSASQYFSAVDYGDAYKYLKDQLRNVGVGLIALIVVFKLKIRLYKKLSYPSLVILLGVFVFMVASSQIATIGGAERWVEVFGQQFQPSEFAKIILPMAMARWISVNKEQIGTFKIGFAPTIAATAITSGLILAQKDLSSALVVAAAAFVMMFCAGIRPRYLLGTVSLGLVAVAGAILLEPYRMERIYAWFNPWAYAADEGWQTCQSLMALGSGGLNGVGLGAGGSKWLYLPARHTDFIFSIIGEELGFLGAGFVVLLIAFIVWRGLMISVKVPDLYTSLLSLGIVMTIAIQSLINLGVVTGLLPVTGITLPFVSYGGTSMVVSLAMIGVLLNISCYTEQ